MRKFTSMVSAIVFAFGSLPASHTAEAGTGILRCAMPDGSFAYTQGACGDLGGEASPLEPDLIDRLARDARRNAGSDAGNTAPRADALRQPGVRREVASGCARSPEQLARDLASSLAQRDVNRVAESFDWKGMDNQRAQRHMDALGRMVGRERLVDADYFDATLDAGHVGYMQVTFATEVATRTSGFDVSVESSCYFLQFA